MNIFFYKFLYNWIFDENFGVKSKSCKLHSQKLILPNFNIKVRTLYGTANQCAPNRATRILNPSGFYYTGFRDLI